MIRLILSYGSPKTNTMRVNDVLGCLDGLTYPTTPARIIAELDDPPIHCANGEERLSHVFQRIRVPTLSSSDDAKLTFLCALNDVAVGRKYYTDRDPPVAGEHGPDQYSL